LKSRSHDRALITSAAFLMATSAIGPGFITQTTIFTEKLLTSFAFVIVASIVIDIIVQFNLWRVLGASGLRAQEFSNRVFFGSGYVLSTLIFLGGVVFNIGNMAGAGLGLQVLTGWDLNICVLVSLAIALFVIWSKEAGKRLDIFARVLGAMMILLTANIALISNPPLLLAARHTVMPEVVDWGAVITLVGGTVGGYISFAGIHRLLDAGVQGADRIPEITTSALRGVLIAGLMRVLLFLAVLGVVAAGNKLDSSNPASSVFELTAGKLGLYFFGLVLWSAAATSIVGCAYTSVSFLKGIFPVVETRTKESLAAFMIFSAVIFLIAGNPIRILVMAGAINAFVLPLALIIVLFATFRKRDLLKGYQHPIWLSVCGFIAALVLLAMGLKVIL